MMHVEIKSNTGMAHAPVTPRTDSPSHKDAYLVPTMVQKALEFFISGFKFAVLCYNIALRMRAKCPSLKRIALPWLKIPSEPWVHSNPTT
jgi:hypothetical protein